MHFEIGVNSHLLQKICYFITEILHFCILSERLRSLNVLILLFIHILRPLERDAGTTPCSVALTLNPSRWRLYTTHMDLNPLAELRPTPP